MSAPVCAHISTYPNVTFWCYSPGSRCPGVPAAALFNGRPLHVAIWNIHDRQAAPPSLQNCFSGDTEFITNQGIKKFTDFKDSDKVIVKGNLSWKEATVKCFGEQDLVELTMKRGKHLKVIKTTLNHRWIIGNKFGKKQSIKTTDVLKKGMILQKSANKTNFHNLQMCPIGIQHGLVFGDGHYNKNAKCCAFVPCGNAAEEYRKLFFNGFNNRKEITGLPYNWKQLPSFEYNKHYIYGFLAGWFAADGTVGSNGTLTLSNENRAYLEAAKGLFAKLDVYSGDINLSRELNPYDGSQAELWRMTIHRDSLTPDFLLLPKHKNRWRDYDSSVFWKVVSVSEVKSREAVWCVVEPDKEEFTLSNGVLTKNCAFTVAPHSQTFPRDNNGLESFKISKGEDSVVFCS